MKKTVSLLFLAIMTILTNGCNSTNSNENMYIYKNMNTEMFNKMKSMVNQKSSNTDIKKTSSSSNCNTYGYDKLVNESRTSVMNTIVYKNNTNKKCTMYIFSMGSLNYYFTSPN